MAADCLVLNKNFYAIQVAPWEQAVSLLWQGHAEAVDENYQTYTFKDWADLSAAMKDSPDGVVHSPTWTIKIPEVIRLTRMKSLPPGQVKFTRRNIYDHFKHACAYCGAQPGDENLDMDHVIPRSRGGKTTWENIVLSCMDCNREKADRTPKEAKMKLKKMPSRPRWRGIQRMTFQAPFKVKESWKSFLDEAFWNVELEHD